MRSNVTNKGKLSCEISREQRTGQLPSGTNRFTSSGNIEFNTQRATKAVKLQNRRCKKACECPLWSASARHACGTVLTAYNLSLGQQGQGSTISTLALFKSANRSSGVLSTRTAQAQVKSKLRCRQTQPRQKNKRLPSFSVKMLRL